MPGPVVVDGEDQAAVVGSASAKATRLRACRPALSPEVAQRPGAARRRRRRTRPADTPVVSTRSSVRLPEAAGLVEHEVVEVERARLQVEGVLVGAGQQQQVLDQPLDPEVLGQHRLRQLGGRRALGVGQGDLGVLADRRRRASAARGRRRR